MIPLSEEPLLAESLEPLTFRGELKAWIKLAIPVAIINFCRTSMSLADISILGHHHEAGPHGDSTDFVAMSSMSGVWSALSTVVLFQGFISALNVLCSTAYGAKNYRLVGYFALIAVAVSTVITILVGMSWWWAGEILAPIVGIQPWLQEYIDIYSRIALIGLIPLVWYSILNQWLQSQEIIKPQLVTGLFLVVLNVVLNYLFIYKDFGGYNVGLDLGFRGSPLATVVGRILFFVLTMSYVLYFGLYKKTFTNEENENDESNQYFSCFPVFSILQNAFTWSRVREYLNLAVPLALTGLLEDGQLQLVSIMAGRLGVVSMDVHNSIFQILWVLSCLMWALSSATRTRMSHYIGAGNLVGTKLVAKVALACGSVFASIVTITLILSRNEIGKLYSDNPSVIHLSSRIATLLGAVYILLTFFYLAMATLSAQGRPNIIAFAFVVGAWCTTMPLCYVFSVMWEPTKGLFGLWLAMACGYGVTTLIACFAVFMSDWEEIFRNAQIRAEVAEIDEVDEGGEANDFGIREGSEPMLEADYSLI
eukprot:g101.t1